MERSATSITMACIVSKEIFFSVPARALQRLSTAVRPSSKHLKTVEAYSRKVNAVSARKEHYLVLEERKFSKELRRRSLNFHFFTTLKPQTMELGHMEARQLKEDRQRNNLNLREVLNLLSSHNRWEPKSFGTTNGILRTIATNFDSIEPSVYARILDLISFEGSANSTDYRLVEKIVGKSLKSRQARKYYSENLCDMVQVAKSLQSNTLSPNRGRQRRFHHLVEGLLLEASSGDDSVTVTGAMVEYLTIPQVAASKERSSLFHRVRERMAKHMQDSLTGINSRKPKFVLFDEDSNKLDPKSVLDMVSQYLEGLHCTRRLKSERFHFRSFLSTLNGFLQSKELMPLKKMQVIAQLHRVGLKPPPYGLTVVHEWLGRNRNLSDYQESDLQLVKSCSRACGYSHSFRLGRLNHALKLKGVEPSHDAVEIFLKIPMRMYRHRPIRKYMHRVMSRVKVERLPKTDIEQLDDVKCLRKGCRQCSQFMKRVALAKAFHLAPS